MRNINSFAAAVHRLRRAQGLQLGDIAARTSYSASYLSKLLHGHRPLLPAAVHEIDIALGADGELDRLASAQRGEGVPAIRPVQLPPAFPDFVGRDDQLRAMNDAVLAPSRPGVCVSIVIEGGFWVGKTALAVHWAARVLSCFPGGCLFADLRGLAPGSPAEPSEVLDGFLQALGVSGAELCTSSLEARVARYRSLLAQRPALVVLDNAANYEQVKALLPAAGSAVVVTSREHQAGLLSRGGGLHIELPPLAMQEGIQLLGRRVGAARVDVDRVAAEELVRRCGRLPMPILIAAEHLQQRRATSLRQLAEQVASDRTRLDLFTSTDPEVNIHGVIDLSYLSLPPLAARVFRLLGISPARTASVEYAAALAELDTERAGQALDTLRRAHLLDQAPAGRFKINCLLHAYARQRGIVEEHLRDVERVHDRTLLWYAASAWAANDTLIPGWAGTGASPANLNGLQPMSFAGFDAAMAWCDAEIDTALKIAAHARTRGAKEALWLLPTAFLPYLVLTRNWTRWLTAATNALATAEDAGSTPGIARSSQALGWVQCELGRTDEGIIHLTEALRLHAQLEDRPSCAWTAYGLARAYAAKRRHAHARAYHRLADRLFTEYEMPIGIAVNSAMTASVYDELGDPETATRLAREALDQAQQLSSTAAESLAYHQLGIMLSRRGQHRAALTHLDAALRLRGKNWQKWGAAETLIARAEALTALGALDQARQSYVDALAILDELGDPRAFEMRAHLAELDTQVRAS